VREFNSRIAAQRHILKIVNASTWDAEQLLGLSARAIERWASANGIRPGVEIVRLLKAASAKLFFLANKSQEHVTNEYKSASAEIVRISELIEAECRTGAVVPRSTAAT